MSRREQVLRSTGCSSTIQKWLRSTDRKARFWEKIYIIERERERERKEPNLT